MDQQEEKFQSTYEVAASNNLLRNAHVSNPNGHSSQKNQKPVIIDTRKIKHYGRRMKLNCRHGYNILILQNGEVSSSDDDIDSHCIMEFTSMSPGHVRIRGVEANLFLAMNKDGLLYGEADPNNNATIFIEQPEGPYSAYLSLKYQRKKWYIAIKKNGKIKLGPTTKRGQHATHFLTIVHAVRQKSILLCILTQHCTMVEQVLIPWCSMCWRKIGLFFC